MRPPREPPFPALSLSQVVAPARLPVILDLPLAVVASPPSSGTLPYRPEVPILAANGSLASGRFPFSLLNASSLPCASALHLQSSRPRAVACHPHPPPRSGGVLRRSWYYIAFFCHYANKLAPTSLRKFFIYQIDVLLEHVRAVGKQIECKEFYY